MEITTKKLKLSQIKLNPDNPRRIGKVEMERMVKSLQDFPEMLELREIIVDENNIILGGNMRYRALKQIGEKECIAKIVTGLTLDQKREFIIKDNSNFGEYDMDALANLWSDLPLVEWGVDLPEDWLAGDKAEVKEDDFDADAAAESIVDPITKPGNVWILGKHRVMCGDSTKKEDVERLCGTQKADMVFTDPPYNVDYGVSKDPRHKIRTIENDKQSPAEWERFCRDLFVNFKLFCRGDIYMWGASSPEGMKMRLWLTEAGCHWSATIIWKKDQLVLSPANYQRIYEPCFYGWFNKSSFVADRKQVEVWDVSRPRDSKLHPTMKPIELCAKGIENSSSQGATVLDLFLGSGSTLIACEQLGRTCYGMEIDPVYVDVIVKRWEALTGQKAVLDERP